MKLYQTEKVNPSGFACPSWSRFPSSSPSTGCCWAPSKCATPVDPVDHDLASKDPTTTSLPVVMVVTMLIPDKLNPTRPDPIQAKVMMAMPFIFGAMFFWFPAGLVLYWVVKQRPVHRPAVADHPGHDRGGRQGGQRRQGLMGRAIGAFVAAGAATVPPCPPDRIAVATAPAGAASASSEFRQASAPRRRPHRQDPQTPHRHPGRFPMPTAAPSTAA